MARRAWRTGAVGVLVAGMLAACGAPTAPTPGPPDDAALFREVLRQPGAGQQFYFVMTDRFANGDPSNDTGGLAGDRLATGFDPADKGFFHGGDLAGLRQRLDYIRGLGTTALWLTPVVTNKPVQGTGAEASAGYHGYWGTDFTRVDPHLGTNAELEALIAAAHERGMKVYLDVVVNHTADVIAYEGGSSSYVSKVQRAYRDAAGRDFDDEAAQRSGQWPELSADTFAPYRPVVAEAERSVKNPAWLNDPTMYHNRGDSTWAGESNTYGDFVGLDDLFTERPEVVRGMVDVYSAWVDLGVDGFRLDTVKHVDLPFWQQFGPALLEHARATNPDFSMFGEVYSSDPAATAPYTTRGRLPATLDFAFQEKANAWARGGSAEQFLALLEGDDHATDADSSALAQPTFLGNHDMGRIGFFQSATASGEQLLGQLRAAHSLMFLTRGQPVVYYGDEQGLIGSGGDRDARQDLFATRVASYAAEPLAGAESGSRDRYDPSHPLYRHIAELGRLRAAHPALATGSMSPLEASGVLAFTRWLPGDPDEYVVVLSNGGAGGGTVELPGTGRRLEPVLGAGEALVQDAAGAVRVDVPAYGVRVYRVAKAGLAGGDVSLVQPNGVLRRGAPLRAQWDGATNGQVSFSVRAPGGEWRHVGTDDNAPWSVHPDLGEHPAGTRLEVRATARASDGTLRGASMEVELG